MATATTAPETTPAEYKYVCCTDKFMSGWGRAEGKTNRLAIPVRSWEDGDKLADWIRRNRDEQIRVTVCDDAPRGRHHWLLQFQQMPCWCRSAGIEPIENFTEYEV